MDLLSPDTEAVAPTLSAEALYCHLCVCVRVYVKLHTPKTEESASCCNFPVWAHTQFPVHSHHVDPVTPCDILSLTPPVPSYLSTDRNTPGTLCIHSAAPGMV